ncbi:hypothetical protein [Sodalis sp.]
MSDALLGYLRFTNDVDANGKMALRHAPYTLALPPRALIDR